MNFSNPWHSRITLELKYEKPNLDLRYRISTFPFKSPNLLPVVLHSLRRLHAKYNVFWRVYDFSRHSLESMRRGRMP